MWQPYFLDFLGNITSFEARRHEATHEVSSRIPSMLEHVRTVFKGNESLDDI